MNTVQIWLLVYVVTVILAGALLAHLFFSRNFKSGMTWDRFRQLRFTAHLEVLRNWLLATLFWPVALCVAVYLCWRDGDYK